MHALQHLRDGSDLVGDSMAHLTEGLGVLAMAADMATGRPKGSGLTAAIVAAEFARRIGEDLSFQKDAYFLAAVRFIGCTITSHETGMMAMLDDQGFAVATMLGDWADREDLKRYLGRFIALDAPEEERDQTFNMICDVLPDAAGDFTAAHCRQSFLLAKRLPVSQEVLNCIPYYYARWDGKVLTKGGLAVPRLSRLVRITELAELVRRLENADRAKEVVAAKLGHELDPELGAAFLTHADAIFEVASATPEFEAFIAAEPGDPILMTDKCREVLAEVGADMTDHKANHFRSHSRRVAALSAAAARVAGMGPEQIDTLRQAALVHDIGKCAISNRIWYKSAPLNVSEQLEMEGHSFQTEFILSHGAPFKPYAHIAACAHERADGSGYHRRVPLSDVACNILAVANTYDELIRGSLNTAAVTESEAAKQLTQAAADKKFLPTAVTAVLKAAGHRDRELHIAYPFGMTRREVQVLARLAKSETTAELAEALSISPKTADHHIQNIYNKTGIRARPALALLALEHGIVMD